MPDPDCSWCRGEPLAPVTGPDGPLLPRSCGVCSELPQVVLDELEDDE